MPAHFGLAAVLVDSRGAKEHLIIWTERSADIARDTINISEKRDGLDFFYGDRASSLKMVEFLQGVVPVRYVYLLPDGCGDLSSWMRVLPDGLLADDGRIKGSEQLISSEKQSNTANYKFTYSVEIVPVCKDDLVCLPRSQARAWGNISYVDRLGLSVHGIRRRGAGGQRGHPKA